MGLSYAESIRYLDSLAQFGWKLDLARIVRLCELAGHPERGFRSVLVAGSAGKGSTCTFLASILRASGLQVGLAPKPHLQTHRERVQVDGRLITEEQFAARIDQIRPWADIVTREEGSPTVFEVMTLLAFLHFAEEAVDWAVVEVGLGGRFDATNVLGAELSVITAIGLDHTDRLGDTVEQIAFEKAGIIKPGRQVLTGAEGGALEVIEARAHELGGPLWRLGREVRIACPCTSASGSKFDLQTPRGGFTQLETGLVGRHQIRNAALATAAYLALAQRPSMQPAAEQAVRAGLMGAVLPARLQVVGSDPLILVDGAHSPDRALALRATLEELYLRAGRPYVLVLGCSAGHAPDEVVRILSQGATVTIATRSGHPAAIDANVVAKVAADAGIEARVVQPVGAAVREAVRAAGREGVVVVAGSLFVAGEALTETGFRVSGE
jgi:dihydrofolate synthase/folylpolyglutamate synthase